MKKTVLVVLAVLLSVLLLFGCTQSATNDTTGTNTQNGNSEISDPLTAQTNDAVNEPSDVNIGEMYE